MNLSKNFRLEEFIKSDTATRNNIKNDPTIEAIANLKHLCVTILQPLRDMIGPVKVNSGYRGSALNKFVGGSWSSQHCKGEAADIEVDKVSTKDLAKMINRNFDFDQIILEFYDPNEGPHSGWVHVSTKKEGNRKETLRAYKDSEGKTRYEEINL